MSKQPSILNQLGDFHAACNKILDPEERTKAFAEWMAKQPENVQRMVADGLPVLQNIGKRIAANRDTANRGSSNAR